MAPDPSTEISCQVELGAELRQWVSPQRSGPHGMGTPRNAVRLEITQMAGVDGSKSLHFVAGNGPECPEDIIKL